MPASPRPSGGRLEVAPDWGEFLRRAGLVRPDAVMDLSGEVVCGHADRHVRRVTLTAGGESRTCYLKREHTASRLAKLKNWRAGAGWVSRAAREAANLGALAALGLPGPRAAAWGEDEVGRAFLLVGELAGHAELRDLLTPGRLDPRARRRLARTLGESVAALHAAGFPTPDLAGKHVLVGGDGVVRLLDWQGSRPGGAPVPPSEALRPLAALDASLSASLTTPRERLLMLGHYLRARGAGGLASAARAVAAASRRSGRRSRSRDQRGGESARLVWLAGESACAALEFAADWPSPPDGSPFYPGPASGGVAEGAFTLAGRRVRLIRFRTADPAGRLLARLRERPWRSPGAEAGRILVHLARHGVPGPRLVGFGQSLAGRGRADSFVAYLDEEEALPVGAALRQDWTAHDGLIASCTGVLRLIHDAGLRPTGRQLLAVVGGSVRVASPLSVRRCKRVTPRAVRADLARLAAGELAGVGAYRLADSYFGRVAAGAL